MSAMSSRTNMLVFHAHKLSQLLGSHEGDENKALSPSIEIAISSVLKDAWLAWLRELNVLLGGDDKIIESVNAFAQKPLNQLPDMQHLINLKQQPHTWLRNLLDRIDPAFQDLAVNKASAQKSGAVDSNAINIVSVDEPETVEESIVLESIISEFKQYINQIRSQHVEW